MYLNLFLAVFSAFALPRMCHGVSADQCPAQEPIYWKALKGYTFKTLMSSSPFECLYHCHYDFRCQSYNYVIKDDICEMNNRTKDAKPEQFVSDLNRFYMKRGAHRVALGSTPSLPAESCQEIKANEAGEAVSGNSWLDPTGSGEVILAHCDMNTEVADFCIRHHCQNGASCVNGHVNYTCLCHAHWTGTFCETGPTECYNFTSLTDADRRPSFHVLAVGFKNDILLGPGWFRFQGDAGNTMTTSCPPKGRCNTHATGWLNGRHPEITDGIVNREVCFSYEISHRSDCCFWTTEIRVRKCGSYFVYFLNSTPFHDSSLRYCSSD